MDFHQVPFSDPEDRRAEMPRDTSRQPIRRQPATITRGIIHNSAVKLKHRRTIDAHFRFFVAPRKQLANGLFTGRGWRNGSYTGYIGDDGRKEWVLPFEVIGNHCLNNNSDSLGLLVEGDYEGLGGIDPDVLSEERLQATVEFCLWIDAALGRRLEWTFHNDVLPGYICPGKFFPKEEVLRRIDAYYVPVDAEDPDAEDPALYPPATQEEIEENIASTDTIGVGTPPVIEKPTVIGRLGERGGQMDGCAWMMVFTAICLFFLVVAFYFL